MTSETAVNWSLARPHRRHRREGSSCMGPRSNCRADAVIDVGPLPPSSRRGWIATGSSPGRRICRPQRLWCLFPHIVPAHARFGASMRRFGHVPANRHDRPPGSLAGRPPRLRVNPMGRGHSRSLGPRGEQRGTPGGWGLDPSGIRDQRWPSPPPWGSGDRECELTRPEEGRAHLPDVMKS